MMQRAALRKDCFLALWTPGGFYLTRTQSWDLQAIRPRRQPAPRRVLWSSASTVPDNVLPRSGTKTRPCQRSEEHTSELQSLMRISYAVFCLKKKIHTINTLKQNQATQT